MQDRQILSNSTSRKTNLFGLFPTPALIKRTNLPSLLPAIGLLASISSVGGSLLYQQSAQAKNSIFHQQNSSLIARLPSLTDSLNTVSVKDLETSSLTASDIPQLPPLNVARLAATETSPPLYSVRSGDTIAGIARQHGVSVKEIIELNNIANPNFIRVNTQLVLPGLTVPQPENQFKSESIAQSTLTSSSESTSTSLDSLWEKKVQFREQKRSNRSEPASASLREDTPDSNNDKNPYISKLRQDIIKLRDKYNNQSGTEKIAVEDSASETERDTTASAIPQKVSVANTNTIELASGSAIAPSLPPLAAPEEYLPDNPIFNGYMWPAKGTLTSGYGWRWGRMHKGIDIAAPIGTPIMAAASGEVIFAGWNSGGYGNLVKLRHRDGSVTFYAHNHRVMVRKGQKVRQGQLIAEMGSTGRSTGPHLHFEIRPNGSNAINPIARLPKER